MPCAPNRSLCREKVTAALFTLLRFCDYVAQMRQRLADILVATVSLRLVKDKTGEALIPVVEVMRTTTTIQSCIREGRLDEIEKHIENGRSEYNMQTMDQHLVDLCKNGIITVDAAKSVSRSMDLERKLMFT